MLKRKRILLFIVAVFMFTLSLFLLIPKNKVFAETMPYSISSLNKQIHVREDKMLEISDEFTLNFANPTSAFTYKLPRNVSTKKTVGSKEYSSSYIAGIAVKSVLVDGATASYKDYYDFESYSHLIYLLSPNGKMNGIHKIAITYDYDISMDRNSGFDDLSIPLTSKKYIPQKFDAVISFPKNIDGADVSFFGSIELDKIEKTSNTIKFSYDDANSKIRESNVSMQLIFEGKYFNYESVFSKAPFWYYIFFGIIVLSIGFVLFLIFRAKYNRNISTNGKQPFPSSDDTWDVYFEGRGVIEKDNCAAKVLEWAQEGYISIIKTKESFTLKKLKDLPDDDAAHYLFQVLTLNAEIPIDGALDSGLENTILRNAFESAICRYNAERLEDGIRAEKILIVALAIFPSILSIICYSVISLTIIFLPIVFSIFALVGYFASYLRWTSRGHDNSLTNKKAKGSVFAKVIIFVFFYCITYILMVFSSFGAMSYDVFYLAYISFAWAIICRLFLVPLYFKIPAKKHNNKSAIMFYNFINQLDSDLVFDVISLSPTYFYDILPYIATDEALVKEVHDTIYNVTSEKSVPDWAKDLDDFDKINSFISKFKKFLISVYLNSDDDGGVMINEKT